MALFLRSGTVVADRYRLDRLLGEGGVGEVWAATDATTLGPVALKFLKSSAHLEPSLRRRFVREARAASAVRHPNVVQIHDFLVHDDGVPIMVMDFLEGETLGQRLVRDRVLSLGEACEVLLPVTSAVGTAHALGIVHRDLKPDNVFLCTAGAGVRVLDFGIAKLVGAAGTETGGGALTETGTWLGTPGYMSPEQSFGEKDIDHGTDVWAIGVMLYEALSGTRPVEGSNIGQVIRRLHRDSITPIEVVAPGLPPAVAALVGRMLSRDRAGRPRDLREVHDVLALHTSVQVPRFGPAIGERDDGPGSNDDPRG